MLHRRRAVLRRRTSPSWRFARCGSSRTRRAHDARRRRSSRWLLHLLLERGHRLLAVRRRASCDVFQPRDQTGACASRSMRARRRAGRHRPRASAVGTGARCTRRSSCRPSCPRRVAQLHRRRVGAARRRVRAGGRRRPQTSDSEASSRLRKTRFSGLLHRGGARAAPRPHAARSCRRPAPRNFVRDRRRAPADDRGGLGFVPALLDGDRFADDGLRVVLLCGQCSEGFLRTALEPRAAAAIRRAWADEATRAASLTARSVVIEHGDPCGMRRWSTKSRPRWVISRTMSEGDPTAEAVRCLRGADEVWVPTAWHVEAYAAAGVERRRLLAVPEPVDVDFFAPDSDAKRGAPFVFFSNFKWEARKGWDLLLEAYWSAFSSRRRPPAAEDVPAVVGGGAARPQPPRRGVRAAARQAARRSRGSRAPRRREHLARRLGRDVPRRRRLRAADARRGVGAADRRGDGERPPRHRDQLLGADRLPHRRQLVPLRVARRLPGGQAEPSVADVAQAMKTRAR